MYTCTCIHVYMYYMEIAKRRTPPPPRLTALYLLCFTNLKCSLEYLDLKHLTHFNNFIHFLWLIKGDDFHVQCILEHILIVLSIWICQGGRGLIFTPQSFHAWEDYFNYFRDFEILIFLWWVDLKLQSDNN